MFHRRHETAVAAVVPPRVRNVRLLATNDELKAAVERARAFENREATTGTRRALKYERYLAEKPKDRTEVVLIDAAEAPNV